MKRLDRTPHIEALLRASFGPDADLSHLVVFEYVAANLNPLRKDSGIYQDARFTQNTLAEMAALVRKESVQLILNHNDSMMPVGRTFAAEVKGEALHTLVALNAQTEAKNISDIEAGILDQVSVSVMPARLICSECDFDYMSDEATSDNWWDLTCNEGHTIGVNGVHARISGAKSWFELSLVGMGAVPGARSVPKSESAFADNAGLQRLAASGVPKGRIICSNHIHQPASDKENHTMDLTALTAQLTDLTTAKVTAEIALTAMTAERDAAKAELAAAATRIAELEASVAAAPSAADHTAVMAAMGDITKRALVALGKPDAEIPVEATALIAKMTEAQTQLAAAIPVGPTSKSTDKDTKPAALSARAYTTR